MCGQSGLMFAIDLGPVGGDDICQHHVARVVLVADQDVSVIHGHRVHVGVSVEHMPKRFEGKSLSLPIS